ncbi:MAG: hypothetical protein HZC44_13750 [Geobacter sp.]|nr:hypothetical protein [Geobacter sp.]
MDIGCFLERILNNQSVGAFVGACAAFMLVVLNDWRRERKKVANICGEIEMNLDLANAKLETVRRNRNALREESRVIPAPILKFNTLLIRQLAAEVLGRMTLDQRRSVEALCYTMEATDGILEDIYALTKRVREPLEGMDLRSAIMNLGTEYDDAIVNLKRLSEMCQKYVAGQYRSITDKQYDRSEYEES